VPDQLTDHFNRHAINQRMEHVLRRGLRYSAT
jgi:hypothetical protein